MHLKFCGKYRPTPEKVGLILLLLMKVRLVMWRTTVLVMLLLNAAVHCAVVFFTPVCSTVHTLWYNSELFVPAIVLDLLQ